MAVDVGGISTIDDVAGQNITIEYEHHEIHGGTHFHYSDALTLASGASQTYLITTPNTTKWAHFVMVVNGTAIMAWTLDEGADRTGTTLQTVINNNRNSSTANTTLIHKSTSGGTTDGTEIDRFSSGTATNWSSTAHTFERKNELMLKQNTKYLLTVTSGTDGNLVNIRFAWYEHTNKV